VSSDPLGQLRDAVDRATDRDAVAFARATRNAVALAILAAAMTPGGTTAQDGREPQEARFFELLGDSLGSEVAAVYRGGEGWTSRAIDLLEPLNRIAQARAGGYGAEAR